MSGPRVVVVDASVSLKWILEDEVLGDEAKGALSAYREGRIEVSAPLLWVFEVVGALPKAVRTGRADWTKVKERLPELLNLPSLYRVDTQALIEAAEFAIRLQCGAYDLVYALLAEALSAPCLTADERFVNAVQKEMPWVIFLGNAEQVKSQIPEIAFQGQKEDGGS